MKSIFRICALFLFSSIFFNLYSSSTLHVITLEANFPPVRLCPGECYDLSPEITDGIAPFNYIWSTGETDSTIVICPVDEQTRYELTITDNTGETLEISTWVVLAPTDRKPIPSITTPICVGETVYFDHPNWGWQPTYHWAGPNGFTTNEREFELENVGEAQAGMYSLYLDYFDGCFTDTIDIELVISNLGESSTCIGLNTCNFACETFDFFMLDGTTNENNSSDLNSASVCGNNGEDVNAVWLGFVAQNGNHTIEISAIACESGDGLRYGLYDNCNLDNLILCSESCSFDAFIINSSILTPGQEYYLYVDGCGSNICSYNTSLIGTTMGSICNDYVPISQITEWEISSFGFGGGSSSWRFYSGDSIVNGMTYRVIDSENGFTKTLIREDTLDRKVYMIKNGNEVLLYDFDLSVGDSYIDPSYGNFWTVDRIELVQSHIGPLRRFWFKMENFGLQWFYDEGVGSIIIDFPAHVVISDPVFGRPQVYAECAQVFGAEDGYNKIRSTIDVTDISICEGESYNGYSSSGIYIDTINIDGGCLELNEVNLEVIPSSISDTSVIICSGEEYLGYDITGQYEVLLNNVFGCDSILNIALEVMPNDTSYTDITICQGTEVNIEGALVNSEGIYYSIIPDSIDCDDILIYQIDTFQIQYTMIDTSICSGDSIVFGGISYLEEGTFTTIEYDSISGCIMNETTLTLDILEAGEGDCLVSTDDISFGVLNIYPNPAHASVTISHEFEPNGIITFYDCTNRKILHKKSSTKNIQIDITKFPNGVYTVIYQSKISSSIGRLVVYTN